MYDDILAEMKARGMLKEASSQDEIEQAILFAAFEDELEKLSGRRDSVSRLTQVMFERADDARKARKGLTSKKGPLAKAFGGTARWSPSNVAKSRGHASARSPNVAARAEKLRGSVPAPAALLRPRGLPSRG